MNSWRRFKPLFLHHQYSYWFILAISKFGYKYFILKYKPSFSSLILLGEGHLEPEFRHMSKIIGLAGKHTSNFPQGYKARDKLKCDVCLMA